METTWVDFRTVKEAVNMQMVLAHYKISGLKTVGDELIGLCPIHKGTGERAFHVSVTKNAFQCFSCKKRGNVLDLVAAMEQCSVRDAALKLQEWFRITDDPTKNQQRKTEKKDPAPEVSRGEGTAANKPLEFELKGIDLAHPYLSERSITRTTAENFGIGVYSGRGSMTGRLVFPIHNEGGQLVAYAGRSIDGSEPKYKFPAGFHKSQVLFNFHRAVKVEDEYLVILVEGFFDTLVLHQAGFPATVALMGCQLSDEQENLLVTHFEEIIILMDGDDAGRSAAGEIAARLVRRMFVRVVDLAPGQQPDRMAPEALRDLLNSVL
jgi:DNA primase